MFHRISTFWANAAINELECRRYFTVAPLSPKNFCQSIKGVHFSTKQEGEHKIRKLGTRYRIHARWDCHFQSFLTRNGPDVLQPT